jgi:hypothetical protein
MAGLTNKQLTLIRETPEEYTLRYELDEALKLGQDVVVWLLERK